MFLEVKFSIYLNRRVFVMINKNLDKLPTLASLPKLIKRPYKALSFAKLSPCTTTEFSKI